MSLNCRSGDLAIVVNSESGSDGMIVTCIKRYDGPWQGTSFEPGWMIDRKIKTGFAFIVDSKLRPIRPDESPEESTEAMRLLNQLPQKEKV